MKAIPELPSELIVNMEDKSMVITPLLKHVMPNVVEYYDQADQAFGQTTEQQRQYIEDLDAQQFSFRHRLGRVNCSYMPGEGSIVDASFAAFSDVRPLSTGDTLAEYIATENPSLKQKMMAAPNTWSQTVRFAHRTELKRAVTGKRSPALSINSIIPSGSYTPQEHWQMLHGDFSAAAEIMDKGLDELQQRLHGRRSETQLEEVDMYGASLGASNATGAALSTKRNVRTLTLQEPIVAVSGLPTLLGRFIGSDAIGEPSQLVEGTDYIQAALIREPQLRAKVDGYGNEPLWLPRAFAAGFRLRNRGLTHPETNQTIKQWGELAARGTIGLLALVGENSGLSEGTAEYLQQNGFDIITVRGVKGTTAPHLIDEHTNLSAIGVPLNVTRGDYDLQASPRPS